MKKLLGMRTLVALLCLVLALAVLTACDNGSGNGGGETTDGETSNTETISFSNCIVLTSSTADENVNVAAVQLVNAVKTHLGVNLMFKTDSESANADACEILIGSTNREESESVLSELNGQNGYVVKRVGNKIVINATSTAMLDDAVTYLVNNYIIDGTDGSIVIERDLCYTYGATGGFSLLGEDNQCQYTLVYSQNVDTETNTRKNDNGEIVFTANKGLDYVYPYITTLWESLSSHTGATILADVDYGPASDENLEILVGATNRPETMTFLRGIAPNEYGYGVVGNKLVIAGWGDYTTSLAISRFIDDYDQYLVESNGVSNIVMLDGDSTVYSYDKWSLDVPLYKGGSLSGVVDLLDYGCELYYVDATLDSYKEYRAQLEAAGYELHQENQIGDNHYATYFDKYTMVHAYYVAYNNTVRVVTESMSTAILPQNEDPNAGEKVTDTTFTMIDLDGSVGNFGNCFIITLEDGSFILHDGGGDASKKGGGTTERDELYNALKYLNKREDGKIVIAAWIISHAHWDHFKNSYDMIKYYYSRKDFVLEKVVYSEPGDTTIYNSYNPGSYISNSNLEQVATWTSAEMVKIHTGQTIQIRNLKITAMLTADDIYPDAVERFNNTSLITRFTVTNSDGASTTMMIVGDTEEVGSKKLVNMYGENLQCDIMQVAHHGSGGSIELYALCKPSVVIWPSTQSHVNSSLSGSGYYPGINQSLCNQKNVVLLVVADNGHKTFSLPLTGLTTNETQNEKLVTVWGRLDGR